MMSNCFINTMVVCFIAVAIVPCIQAQLLGDYSHRSRLPSPWESQRLPRSSSECYSTLTLYENGDRTGRQLVRTDSDSTLADDGFNDRVSAVQVTGECQWILYERTDYGGTSDIYGGESSVIGPGDYLNATFGIPDNALSSLRCLPEPCVTAIALFQHNYYRGNMQILSSPSEHLGTLDNTVTSFIVTRGVWQLFSGPNYTGSSVTRGVGHYPTSNNLSPVRNDDLSSVGLEDNGIIQCVRDDPTDMTSTSANTTISVLTDDFQLGVVVTEEGNLRLTVMLQNVIPEPVRLRIKYTWVIQPDQVERTTSRTFDNSGEIVHEESQVPFQQFRLQVALVVGRVVGPFVPDLKNATVITLPAVATPPELTIALSVLVPFSVLLILVISVSVPAAILKRRKKVETNQDYTTIHANTGKPKSRSAAHPTPSQCSHPTPKKEPSRVYEIPTSQIPPKEDIDLKPNPVYGLPTSQF